MKLPDSARFFQIVMSVWRPFRGAGIRVEYISNDWKEVRVRMHLYWFNRNALNTHFGGNLYSMTDPFYVLMIIQRLGPEYTVWDKASHIEYVKPGRGTVRATFRLEDETIDRIREFTAHGHKHLETLPVNIVDESGDVVARVSKTVYIRRKRPRLERAA